MAMYAKVRRMRFRDGLSISEIARRTSLTRNTVKKWLNEPARSEMKYERPAGPRKLDAHADWLLQALEADARRPAKDRRTGLRLYLTTPISRRLNLVCPITVDLPVYALKRQLIDAFYQLLGWLFRWRPRPPFPELENILSCQEVKHPRKYLVNCD